VIRRVIDALPRDLRLVALEVGVGQARTVASLLTRSRTNSIEIVHDLAGYERVVVGRR
jgi:methylase of polypeptide subunit release factors